MSYLEWHCPQSLCVWYRRRAYGVMSVSIDEHKQTQPGEGGGTQARRCSRHTRTLARADSHGLPEKKTCHWDTGNLSRHEGSGAESRIQARPSQRLSCCRVWGTGCGCHYQQRRGGGAGEGEICSAIAVHAAYIFYRCERHGSHCGHMSQEGSR